MLQTLIAAGYVKQHENVRGYVVTSAIRHLSSGFHGAPMVIEAARPLADKLTRDIVWPCAICTLDLDSVVINYSTSPESPIAPFHTSLGMRLSLGGRALGRAYVCFCPPNEQRILRNAMRVSDNPENSEMDDATFANILATARANGFAERNMTVTPQSSGTIAVPIRLGKRVLATFGVTYFKSALKQRQSREAVIKAVFKTAAQIEARLQA
jgi:IclR family mhp operon transcriptional activator